MINKVILVGRITRDLEIRKTPNGASTLSFSLAVNRKMKVNGQPDADFINCVAWNKTADTMAQYLHKGSLIGVEGRIQTRSYDNQQGQRVYVTEVVVESFSFLESNNKNSKGYDKQSLSNTSQNLPSGQTQDATYGGNYDDTPLDIAPDDLPF